MNKQKETMLSLITSWSRKDSEINSIEDILTWIEDKNKSLKVNIIKNRLSDSDYWFLDTDGIIKSKNNGFFKIAGLKKYLDNKLIVEQPIMLQQEIGYLGIICKKINGIIHLLMQAKIEPGNINKIQISPTIQATKSNFTRKHGGKKPAYLDEFLNASSNEIIFDQIQSEQSSRFYKKRNRNIMIILSGDDDIEVLESHKWMTLGQVKSLMKEKNLVNMDTRTVLSCIPFALYCYSDNELTHIENCFENKSLFQSIFINDKKNYLPKIFNWINNKKMFDNSKSEIVSLSELGTWKFDNFSFSHMIEFDFKVIFCDISIEDREVSQWTQPLFEALGKATFGLIVTKSFGKMKFLVKLKEEPGTFDIVEIGPTIQLEPTKKNYNQNPIEKLFWQVYEKKETVLYDTILSEEGGRFYHEENYNIIVEVAEEQIPYLEKYILLDFFTLNHLIQYNNILNIQLRNLLALFEV